MTNDEIVDRKESIDDRFVVGEIDYAILLSMTNGIDTITGIANMLQIRTLIIEKHIYMLLREGFVGSQLQHFSVTSKGNDAIFSFERENSEDIWAPIDEFIISVMKKRKEQKIEMYKMINIILLVLMICLVIFIIYLGKDLFI